MTQAEIEILLNERETKIREVYAVQFQTLKDRIVKLENAHNETVMQLAKRITQLGG